MLNVAFIDFIFEDLSAIQLEGCEFEIHPPLCATAEIITAARDADVLVLRDQFGQIDSRVLAGCPSLKLIVTRSAGHDHIDLDAARERGIVVSNVPDYGAHMIAEHAFALMLAVARNVCRGNQRYRQAGRFDDAGLAGTELFGKILGVIGAGRIGRHSIRIGQGFGMDIMAFDLMPDPNLAAEFGFRYTSLDDLLEASHYLTIHVPLLDSTRHLIDARALARLRPGAILVNTSRGAVVDTAALKDALLSGRLLGAGLDVLEEEKTTYHDFAGLNVVVTPHVAWYTDEARGRIMDITLENIRAWIDGRPVNRIA